jgi:hypothetical protein
MSSKIYPNWNYWYANVRSGKPAHQWKTRMTAATIFFSSTIFLVGQTRFLFRIFRWKILGCIRRCGFDVVLSM